MFSKKLISDAWLEKQKEAFRNFPGYGAKGQEWISRIMPHIQSESVLDYGCGRSTLSMNIPFLIQQYDPAIQRFSELPEKADLIILTNVLEYVEPELLDNVIEHICYLEPKKLYVILDQFLEPKTFFNTDIDFNKIFLSLMNAGFVSKGNNIVQKISGSSAIEIILERM